MNRLVGEPLRELGQLDDVDCAEVVDRSRRAVIHTTASQITRAVVQLGSMVVLGRLVSPRDFGLVAMVSTVVMMSHIIAESGLGAATIQRPKISAAHVSSLFWINTGLGFLVAAVVAALSPLIASFFGEPELTGICMALSTTFVFAGVAVQSDAILRRQLRFFELAAVDIASAIAGLCTSVVAALVGAGYWALVAAVVTPSGLRCISLLAICGWRPTVPRWAAGTYELLKFGGKLTAGNIVGALAGSLMPVLVALTGTASIVGFYNRAVALSNLPMSQAMPPIMNVAQSALARWAERGESFTDAVKKILSFCTLLGACLFIVLFCAAESIVRILLGPSWFEAAAFLKLLSVTALIEPTAQVLAVSLVAKGFPGALLKWRMLSAAIIMPSLFLGALWGPAGVVTAYVAISFSVRVPLFVVYSCRTMNMNVLATVRRPAIYVGMVAAIAIAQGTSWSWLPQPELPFVDVLASAIWLLVFLIAATALGCLRSETAVAMALLGRGNVRATLAYTPQARS